MTEKRNITRADIHLEARIRAEGTRVDVKGSGAPNPYPMVVLDGCDIIFSAWENPVSRLVLTLDGDDVVISDEGEILGVGKLEARPSWFDLRTTDGTTAQYALPWSTDMANVVLWETQKCFHANTGNPCKYCSMSIPGATRMPTLTSREFEAHMTRQVEALVLALQNGWRGQILFGAGTPPRSLHHQITDHMEIFLTRVREAVGEQMLSQNHISEILFSPPEDLGLLHRWKDIGLNSAQFESEVVNPAYFRAICPAKGQKQRWLEAMFASAEVFGRGRGATTGIVMGIEPMSCLLEGIEELVAGGVFPQLYGLQIIPGTAMYGMMPPSAKWFIEATEKIVDIYLRYADTFDVDLRDDTRFGCTRRGRSYCVSLIDDELARRLQEMGKLGPGLPRQGGLEL